jgi:nucleoside-diphosphate-sugar epimerase
VQALVTGSSGFIGTHMVHYLESQGYEVRGFDRLMGPVYDLSLPNSASILDQMVSDCDEVYHLAGNANVRACETDPLLAMSEASNAAYHVLNACHKNGKPVVVISSAQVYCPCPIPCSEVDPPMPENAYGAAKLAVEGLCSYYRALGTSVIVARLFNLYGPGQTNAVTYSGTVVTDYIRKFLATPSGDVDVNNPHSQRDFVYIDDVVVALHTLAVLVRQPFPALHYNIGTGSGTTILQLIHLIAKTAGFRGRLIPGAKDLPQGNALVADIRSLKEQGWKPMVSLEEGVKRTVEAFRK